MASTTNRISSGYGVADVGRLPHHLGVDAEPAGGVDDDGVVLGMPGVVDRPLRDRDRVANTIARFRGEHRDPGALAEHLQLLYGVRALQVGGDEHRRMALALEPAGQLAGQGGLT